MARRDARALRDEVAAAIDKGKFKQALEAIFELEVLEPRDAAWPKRAAEVYRRIGRTREAIQAYERSVERYAQNGFLVQAIAVCKQILQLDPEHSATLKRLSQITEQRNSTPMTGVARLTTRETVPQLQVSRNTGPVPLVDPATILAPDKPVEMLALETPPPPAPPSTPPAVAKPPPIPPPLPKRATPPPIPPPRKKPHSTPVPILPGAALDTVSLADVIPGAADASGDGTSSGIIVIPLEDMDDAADGIEVEAAPPASETTFEVGLDAVEEAEEPSIEYSLTADAEDDEHPLGSPRMLSSVARRAVRGTPLLASLEPEALEELIERLDLVTLEAGEMLFREGDPGDTLYIISEGEVAILSEGPPRIELSRLFTGSFFGELALVTDAPRSATIEARAHTELLAIDRKVVASLITQHPEVLVTILRFIKNRLVERVMATSPLFIQFPEGDDRRLLADRFEFIEVEPGTALVTHGKRPDGLYVLLAGRAEVLRDLGEGATRSIGWLGIGEVFGEMSLWSSEVSLATVIARGKMLALRMPSATFREVIMTHPQVLAYVGDLAEERRRTLEAPPEDSGDMVDLKLDLL